LSSSSFSVVGYPTSLESGMMALSPGVQAAVNRYFDTGRTTGLYDFGGAEMAEELLHLGECRIPRPQRGEPFGRHLGAIAREERLEQALLVAECSVDGRSVETGAGHQVLNFQNNRSTPRR
jgi:hypothetical protein